MRRNPDNPSTLLYWNDLEGEPGLKFCGLAGYGLWLKMLGLAARSPEYGVVLIGDHPSLRQDLPALLATAGGETVEVIEEIINKLITFKVASVDITGRVFNRRMVEEARLSAARSAAGRKGAAVTNSERQTSGKRVGKQGSKASGKRGGKSGGRQNLQDTSPATLNGHDRNEAAQQNADNTPVKSSPSSSFCLSSVSKDTGAKAPRFAENDPVALIFGQWLAWLTVTSGQSEKSCRALLGKWRKARSDEDLIEVLEAAKLKAIDPVPWVEAAIKARKIIPETPTRAAWAQGMP